MIYFETNKLGLHILFIIITIKIYAVTNMKIIFICTSYM